MKELIGYHWPVLQEKNAYRMSYEQQGIELSFSIHDPDADRTYLGVINYIIKPLNIKCLIYLLIRVVKKSKGHCE
jgi:hypothetical protein